MTLVEVVTVTCVVEEVLAQQYEQLNKKDKGKNNDGGSTSSNNGKFITT